MCSGVVWSPQKRSHQGRTLGQGFVGPVQDVQKGPPMQQVFGSHFERSEVIQITIHPESHQKTICHNSTTLFLSVSVFVPPPNLSHLIHDISQVVIIINNESVLHHVLFINLPNITTCFLFADRLFADN